MLERFKPAIDYGGVYSDAAYMERDDDGDYVKFQDAEKYRSAMIELVEALGDALSDRDNPHDFDLSDDQYLSDKRRRLLDAIKAAKDLSSSERFA